MRSGWPASAMVLRMAFTRPSFASAPELQKNTESAKLASTKRCARRSAPGTRYRLETCITRRLLGDRRDEMRMPMPQRAGGDARAEIKETSPRAVEQIGTFTMLESKVGPVVVRH